MVVVVRAARVGAQTLCAARFAYRGCVRSGGPVVSGCIVAKRCRGLRNVECLLVF